MYAFAGEEIIYLRSPGYNLIHRFLPIILLLARVNLQQYHFRFHWLFQDPYPFYSNRAQGFEASFPQGIPCPVRPVTRHR